MALAVTGAGAPLPPALVSAGALPRPGEAGVTGLALGGSEFLQLLVAHLRYQDPLRPVEDREMAAQLAQFAALEQLAAEVRLSRTAAALGLLGRQVTAAVAGREVTGTVAAVRFQGGRPVLEVAGTDVDLDQLVRVTAG